MNYKEMFQNAGLTVEFYSDDFVIVKRGASRMNIRRHGKERAEVTAYSANVQPLKKYNYEQIVKAIEKWPDMVGNNELTREHLILIKEFLDK